MEDIIFLGLEFLASFLPFSAVLIFNAYIQNRKNGNASLLYLVSAIIFAVYIIAVFHFTGTGTIYDILRYKLEIDQGQINLLPFSNYIDIIAYALNVILFIPLGMIAPYIRKKKYGVFGIFITGFVFSLLIEVSQLLNNRSTDIDDLILNTLGAVIGYIIYKLFMKVTDNRLRLKRIPDIEPFIYISVLFLGRFLLFNEEGLAGMLYGF